MKKDRFDQNTDRPTVYHQEELGEDYGRFEKYAYSHRKTVTVAEITGKVTDNGTIS